MYTVYKVPLQSIKIGESSFLHKLCHTCQPANHMVTSYSSSNPVCGSIITDAYFHKLHTALCIYMQSLSKNKIKYKSFRFHSFIAVYINSLYITFFLYIYTLRWWCLPITTQSIISIYIQFSGSKSIFLHSTTQLKQGDQHSKVSRSHAKLTHTNFKIWGKNISNCFVVNELKYNMCLWNIT